MSQVDNSPNGHRILAREALQEIKTHLKYFRELERDEKHKNLVGAFWSDLAVLLKKNLPKRARELLK